MAPRPRSSVPRCPEMDRRAVVALLAATAATWPRTGLAQSTKVHRIGLLSGGPPVADAGEEGAALIRDLAARGYALGRNLSFERRGASGWLDRLPGLARELVAANVDVVVT